MTTIDGDEVSGITIDGEDVQEVTVDGDVVWSAQTYIENWPTGDLSEYIDETSEFTVRTSPPSGGPETNVLETTGGGYDEIYRTNSSQPVPERGKRYRIWLYGEGTTSGQYSFRWASDSSGDNCYEVRYEAGSDEFVSYKWSDGSAVEDTFNSGIDPYPGDEWWYMEVDFGSSTIATELYDHTDSLLESDSFSDSEYDGGYIGFRPYVSGTMLLGPVLEV